MRAMDDVISNKKIINDVTENTIGVCAICGKIHKPGQNGLPVRCAHCGRRITLVRKTALEIKEVFSGNI